MKTIMRFIDPLLVALAAWLAYPLAQQTFILPEHYQEAIIHAVLITVIVFNACNVYEQWRGESFAVEIRTVLFAWGVVLISMLLLSTATKTTILYSRLWMGFWLICGIFLLLVSRLIINFTLHWLRSSGFNQRQIIILGTGELATQVTNQLTKAPWIGLKILGFFCENTTSNHNLRNTLPLLGDYDNVADYIKQHKVDQIWIAIPWYRKSTINRVLFNLRHNTVDIRMVPDIFSYRLLNASLSEVAGLPILNLSASPLSGTNRIIKALEDRVLAFMILVLIIPVMFFIALGVKFSSPGPVIFRQKRHGYDGKEVEVWKFRSMKSHREQEGKITQASHNDPRVTRFGAFLRRTSLDELPQFINVLQGKMSIVGPRPHAIQHNEYYKDEIERYMLRHKVKPGITGWAQVNGLRGETNCIEKMRRRVEYDLYYIENWSLWFDLKIIVMTLFRSFTDKNAY